MNFILLSMNHFYILKISFNELCLAINKYKLIYALAILDLKSRYTRSILGPFWITINIIFLLIILTTIFSSVLGKPALNYFLYLASGIIFWQFLSNSIIEGSDAFNANSDSILQAPNPLLIYPLKSLLTNLFVFFHNALIIPVAILFLGNILNINLAGFLAAFTLFFINIFWISLLFALLNTRFKDIKQILLNFFQALFYATPIIWDRSFLDEKISILIVELNPFFHLLSIVRSPLLGEDPVLFSWIYCVAMAVIGVAFTLYFYGRCMRKISYWV